MEWTEDDVYAVADALAEAASCRVEAPRRGNETEGRFLDLTYYTADGEFVDLIQEDEGSRPYLHLRHEEGMGHTKVVFGNDFATAAHELFKAYDQWDAYAKVNA